MNKTIEIKNKKAAFEFFLLERFEAGMVLLGTEIKSIRQGKASIMEAYCAFENDELFVKNMHITEYEFGTDHNHEPRRSRKLLLNHKEIKKLLTKTKERGFTLIPVRLYINDKGLAKLEIALAKGKKLYDKRETIKQKDIDRDTERQRI
ncbi:MAG: SsrA-binding protein SmpB [Bacteroidales bacterium]|nr:SsrA-binding protein SmpB [Bacteroidales bacterium]